ncbi:MAG: sigma 54-interacting transcriptional regulator [bacterium]
MRRDPLPLVPADPLTPVDPVLRSLLDHADRPAILLSPDYRVLAANAAYRAHYGAATLRPGVDRCHAISHGYDTPCDHNGEDCPLAASRDTRRPARVFHVHHGPDGPEHVDVELRPLLGADGEPIAYIELIRPLDAVSARRDGFIGRSPAFRRAVELIHRVAPSDTPVLLLGASGTGKELAAAAIHAESARARGPFVPVECSGLSSTLFESELFGHERGAFTGAHARHDGLVAAAAAGTLFLDEIGDVPLEQQVKLLRLLESGRYRRVGGTELHRADFRLVCATHRDLDALVADGRFRADLYYRIAAFPIAMPSLRARGAEDITLLAEAFLARRAPALRLSPEAAARLGRWPFPGNVRELRNVIERAVLLCDGDTIEPAHLPFDPPAAPPAVDDAPWPWGDDLLPLAEVEARYLRWAAARFPGDRRALAAALGLGERTLYRRLGALDGCPKSA